MTRLNDKRPSPDPAALAWAARRLRTANPGTWALLRVLCHPSGFRAFTLVYAYFREADDIVDAPGRDPAAVRAYVAAQTALLRGERAPDDTPERALIAGLSLAPDLRPAATRMLDALCFDAQRGPDVLADAALEAQLARVGDAWLDAAWRCAGPGAPPPDARWAARGATLVHVLRDQALDRQLGYFNGPDDPAWVARRAADARRWMDQGLAAVAGRGTWRQRAIVRVMVWKYRRVLSNVTLSAG